jgi:hypothetical protein
MLNEKIAAQDRVGLGLGFTQEELRKFQSLARFRTAQEYMRLGQKLRALKLTRRSLHAVPSIREAVRMFAGLVTPRPLLNWRKLRNRQAARERYGSIEI